jgi:hypothetical protein
MSKNGTALTPGTSGAFTNAMDISKPVALPMCMLCCSMVLPVLPSKVATR